MFRIFRIFRRALFGLVVAILILVMGNGSGVFSPIDIAAAPYRFELVSWEISHLPDKWWHKLVNLLPWNSTSQEERLADLMEFFQLGGEVRSLEQEVDRLVAQASQRGPEVGLSSQREQLDALEERWKDLRASAEEALESEINAVLDDAGLPGKLGIMFPPVDLAFSDTPRVLVVSPRDRIDRIKTILIEPDITAEEMETLEDKLFTEQELSALVEGTGGVATYPAIVPGKSGLLRATETGTHEWLHQYWFFKPLGRSFNSSSQMRTLNETAADLAGDELGGMVYEAITGEKVERPQEPSYVEAEEEDAERFSFRAEMHKTRLRVDELLAEGRIEEAESYMEERRQLFVENGFYIRKLNQAYFAFHGTYAASPASVSPIHGQLEVLRSNVDSVGEFVRTVAQFSNYEEFEAFVSSLPPAPEAVGIGETGAVLTASAGDD